MIARIISEHHKSRYILPKHISFFIKERSLYTYTVKVKSLYEPSGPSGRSLSRFPWQVFLLPPGQDAGLLQGYPQP